MFQCKDLLALPSMAKARVISGKGGMNRGIRWAYKAETMDFSQWIHGQELLIISAPVIQKADFDLFALIQEAIENRMSGALLLIGEKYVAAISKEVMEISNRNDFPLMVIPWNVPLVNIFEEMGHAISYHENMENDGEDLLESIIFGNNINIHTLELKSQMIGYDITPPQQIFVIHFFKEKGKDAFPAMENMEKQEIIQKIIAVFKENGYQVLASCYSNNLVGMMQAEEKKREKAESAYEEICQYLADEKKEWSFAIGVGKSYEHLADLQKSFQDASKCITLAEKLHRHQEVLWYDKLGFYRLLMSFENQELLESYCEEVIGGLIQYDEENHTELVETLKEYFLQNCNLQNTSEKMFIHRNTIKYRLQRIEQLTGKSFHDAFEILELHNAVIIYTMYHE